MDRWVGRVAVVTGASAGIGAAIAYQLQDHGLNVVALARRVDKVEGAVAKARDEAKTRNRYTETKVNPGKLYPRKCDVQKEEDILATFKWVADTLGKVDILVNNAGVVGEGALTETATDRWRRTLDTNVIGLSICTREAVKIMREKGVDDGHVINIGSVAGHWLPAIPNVAMYCASKHAVRALTEGLRRDFLEKKSKLRVTEVSPGAVRTDIGSDYDGGADLEERYKNIPFMESEDIADAVVYAISTPPHVQIHEIIIRPVGEFF